MGSEYNIFEGLTIRNTDIAFFASEPRIPVRLAMPIFPPFPVAGIATESNLKTYQFSHSPYHQRERNQRHCMSELRMRFLNAGADPPAYRRKKHHGRVRRFQDNR